MAVNSVNPEYIISVASALSVFFIASVEDIREREVSNVLWIFLGTIGFALLAAGIYDGSFGVPRPAMAVLPLPLFLFADMFVDWDALVKGRGQILRYSLLSISAALAVVSALPYIGSASMDILLSIPLWTGFIFLLYKLDVVKGGADAKALVSLCILFPLYPSTLIGRGSQFLTALTFPPFLSVLMMGAVFSLAVPVALFFSNASRGRVRMPHMVIGRMKPVDAVDTGKEWLMEFAGPAGEPSRVKRLGSMDDEAELQKIREIGWKTVWVSPKIPFIIPLTAGLLFVLVLGNPILLL